MAYEIIHFSYDGAVDADGHVLEPATLWEEYLEEKYQDRPIRIVTDDDGLEELEINGQRSQRTRAGSLGLMGAMGEKGIKPSADRRYMDHVPFGAGNPTERVELLGRENLDRALLYPTIGLLWECEVDEPEITLAYQRAYNRWIADFCRDSGGKLVPIAHLTPPRPGRLGRRTRTSGRGRVQRRVRGAVYPQPETPWPSRPRPALGAGPGPRCPPRHPPHLRAAQEPAAAVHAR